MAGFSNCGFAWTILHLAAIAPFVVSEEIDEGVTRSRELPRAAFEQLVRAGRGTALEVAIMDNKGKGSAIEIAEEVGEKISLLQIVVRRIADERKVEADIGISRL